MGTWGAGILQNDTTADIWEEFKNLYNKGGSPKEIRIQLEEEYSPQEDDEYYGEIWTGIAHGQWMCGGLEDYTLEKVKAATHEKWLALWIKDEKLYNKRLIALNEFIEKIQVPRPSALRRKTLVERAAFFKKGDVIGIKINKDFYLGGLVIGHNDDPAFGENTIVLSESIFEKAPTLEAFLASNVLYLDLGGPYKYHRGFFRAIFSAKNMSKKIKNTSKIGEVLIEEYLSFGMGIRIGDWNKLDELYNEQMAFLENNKSDRPFMVTMAEVLRPTKELQERLDDWDRMLFKEALARAR